MKREQEFYELGYKEKIRAYVLGKINVHNLFITIYTKYKCLICHYPLVNGLNYLITQYVLDYLDLLRLVQSQGKSLSQHKFITDKKGKNDDNCIVILQFSSLTKLLMMLKSLLSCLNLSLGTAFVKLSLIRHLSCVEQVLLLLLSLLLL